MKEKLKSILNNKLVVLSLIYALLFVVGGFCKYLEVLMIPYLIFAFIYLDIENDFYLFLITQIFYVSRLLVRPSIVAQGIYIAVLFVKFIIGCKNGKYQLYKKLLIWIGAFTVYGIFVSLFHKMAVYSLSYLMYLPFFYIVFATRKEYDVKKIFRILTYTIFLTSVLSLVTLLKPCYNFECLKHEGTTIRFKAFFGSANTLYMVCLLALTGMSYLFFKRKIGLLEYAVDYALLGILTLLTLSKAGIATLGVLTIINIVLYLRMDFKHHWWHILLILVGCGLCALVFRSFVIRVLERYLKNFDEDNIWNSLFTGRIDIWKDYLKAIFSSGWTVLFGHGILSKYVYCFAQGEDRAQHNLYIFLMYKFGIVGCILLALIIREFIIASNKRAPKFINYLPLIYFLILGMCDNAFMYTHFYILVAMALFDTDQKSSTISKESKLNNCKAEDKINVETSNSEHLDSTLKTDNTNINQKTKENIKQTDNNGTITYQDGNN